MFDFLVEIRKHPEDFRRAAAEKGIALDLDRLLKYDTSRRALLKKVEEARRRKNEVSDAVAKEKDQAKREASIAAMRELKETLRTQEAALAEIEAALHALLLLVPNIPFPGAPRGPDASANVEIRRWGTVPVFSFPVQDHLELGKSLDLIDTERGAAVSGFRGYFLKNEGVLLQQGVLLHALKKVQAAGFTLMVPPTIVKEFALIGSGHFPAAREETYQVVSARHANEQAHDGDADFLVGTSEPSLLAYFANETLSAESLPKLLCGISPCYRSEVGSYGKDTKGIYRIHEFMKVEQVVIAENDLQVSTRWFETILAIAESILQDLALPYRVVETATGDMGPGKYRMVDIETWMPGRKAYGETHSNSQLTDWQARRLNIRYRAKDGKTRYVHTLNNTAIASPRILIPLLENNQQADGSVRVPDVLQPYVGKELLKPRP